MKKQEMKITIGKDGAVNIAVKGVGGSDCLEFSKFLEEELGEVVERERTAEFYEETTSNPASVYVGGNDDDDD